MATAIMQVYLSKSVILFSRTKKAQASLRNMHLLLAVLRKDSLRAAMIQLNLIVLYFTLTTAFVIFIAKTLETAVRMQCVLDAQQKMVS